MTESQILWIELEKYYALHEAPTNKSIQDAKDKWEKYKLSIDLQIESFKYLDENSNSKIEFNPIITHENIMNLLWEHEGKYIKIKECIHGSYFSDDIPGALSKSWFMNRLCCWPVKKLSIDTANGEDLDKTCKQVRIREEDLIHPLTFK